MTSPKLDDFHFRIEIDGREAAGFSRVEAFTKHEFSSPVFELERRDFAPAEGIAQEITLERPTTPTDPSLWDWLQKNYPVRPPEEIVVRNRWGKHRGYIESMTQMSPDHTEVNVRVEPSFFGPWYWRAWVFVVNGIRRIARPFFKEVP